MADDPGWTPKQDMSLLCRVCANQHDYLIPIFEGEGLDHDMPTKMDKHLPIKVRENDKLPTQMCYQCASTIIAWSELVTNCLEADKKLSRMLKINEKKSVTAAIADEDEHSDHYEDTYDDVGGGDDDDTAAAPDDEDFEKEIKQLISDAGVELVSKSTKSKTIRTSTRKRKSETVTVKKESKKSKTDSSVNKSSTSLSLIKPKEEVTSSDDRSMIWGCCKCVATFASWSHLSVHLLSHASSDVQIEKDEKEKCSLCHRLINSHAMQIITSRAEILFCDQCDQIFSDKMNLKTHIRLEHEMFTDSKLKWYKCDICCDKLYRRFAYLCYHMENVHHIFDAKIESCLVRGIKDVTFPCKVCEDMCVLSRYCVRHKVTDNNNHAVSSEQPNYSSTACSEHARLLPNSHSCQKCEASFENCNGLWSHMFIEHENSSDFNCNLCGVEDSSYSKFAPFLERHMKLKHSVNLHIPEVTNLLKTRTKVLCRNGTEKYKCVECSKLFPRFFYLKEHFYSHANEIFYKCDVCGKGFKKQNNLNAHMSYIHTDTMKHICPTCGQSYNGKFKLLSHMRIHSEDRTFTCDVCGASFKQREGLTSHKIRHLEKSFICPYCGLSFRHPNNFRNHKRVHTDSPKYTCEYCGRKFLRADTLRNHVGVRHNTLTPFKCSTCNEAFKIKKLLQRHCIIVGHQA